MSKITNDALTLVWHRVLYSCTHTATVGVEGLTTVELSGDIYQAKSTLDYDEEMLGLVTG